MVASGLMLIGEGSLRFHGHELPLGSVEPAQEDV